MTVRRPIRIAAVALAATLTFACSKPESKTIAMRVADLVPDPRTQSPVLILEAEDGPEVLQMWIGAAEARAIGMEMAGVHPERPMTHDLMRSLVGELGAEVQLVEVTDLRDSTFIAEITCRVRGDTIRIDARPSDAIALALRTGAPIRANAEVVRRAASTPAEGRQASTTHTFGLGIEVQTVSDEIATAFGLEQAHGVLVRSVPGDSVGAAVGLRRGDIVTRVNSRPVDSVVDFELASKRALGGERVEMVVRRDGAFMRLLAKL